MLGNILDTIENNRTLSVNAKKCIAGLYKSIDKIKLVKNSIRLRGAFLTGGSSIVAEFAISNALDNMLPSKEGIAKDDLMAAFNKNSLKNNK